MNMVCPQCQQSLDADTHTAEGQFLCRACGHTIALPAGNTTSYTPSGQRIGKFELLDELGSGGFGTVWRARDCELDRLVAIKLPHAGRLTSPQDQERFLREGRNAARLRHPNIVPVHEVAHQEGVPYLVTDFVSGVNLADFLTSRRLTFREAADLTAQVADALAYAHAQGVIHRDVKPSNIMLELLRPSVPAAPGKPLVMDFGLALRDGGEATLTVEGQVLGTPAYMSPEQAAGQSHRVDGRIDVYSLGVVLYQLLTGELPFRGNARMLLHQVMHDEPRAPRSLNDHVPRDLETICLKAMGKEAGQRYTGAAEMRDDLQRYLRGEPILARPVGRTERLWRWYKRNPLVGNLLAAVFLLLTALAIGGVAVAFRERQSAENERIARFHAEDAEGRAQHNANEANGARKQEALAKIKAVASEKEAYRRLVQMHVATGVRHMEDGDLFGALPWLTAALAEERDPALRETHRYRLGSILRSVPRLVHFFHQGGEPVKHAEFSRDGRLVLTMGDQTVKLWDLATGGEVRTIKHAPLAVAAFSPNSRQVLSASGDGTARIWDVASGREVAVLRHDGAVQHAAFSPDGKRVVTAGDKTTARIWDWSQVPPAAVVLPHGDEVRRAAFSPDSKRVVTVGSDGKARVWDAVSGAPISPFISVNGLGRWAEFSPDGKRVAVAGGTQGVVADASSGRILASIQHRNLVYMASFSPDGQRVLTSGMDMTARLSRATGGTIAEVKHLGAVDFVAFSPDGRRFVTSGEEMTARVWDGFTGQPIAPLLKHTNVVPKAAFSTEGRFLVTACEDGVARVWDLAPVEPQVPRIIRPKAYRFRISPDTRRMATAESDQTVRVWNLESGAEVCPLLRHPARVNELCFDADGRRLFTCGADGVARTWDVASGKQVGVPLRHGSGILRVCLGPDGRRALTGGEDNQVRGWDLATGREIGPTLPHGGGVYWIQFSRDGRRILTASRDGKARVWDAASGQPLTPPLPHYPLVERIQDDGPALSPDGQRLVTQTGGFDAQIWDASTGRSIGPPLKHSGGPTSVSFSPDGRRVLTTSNDLRAMVWDAATGKPVLSALRHSNWVRDGTFSPDSRRIATASWDYSARVWDAATGLPLSPLPHASGVHELWFSPDGRRLVTQYGDGLVQVWDVSPDDRTAEDLVALARVLTSQQLDASDALLALERDELRKTWESLRSRRPGDFDPLLQNTPVWQQRQAEAAEAHGQWFAAAFHWGALLAAQPDNALWHLHRGRARMRLGQQAEALEEIDRVLAKDKTNPDAWAERAAIYAGQRQWEKAAADYSQAITLRGDRPSDWSGRGNALAELGRWEDAERNFGRAIELGQADLTTSKSRVYAYLADGRMDDFRKARAAMLRQFHKSEDFTAASLLGHLYFFEPGEPDDSKDLRTTLERAAAKNSKTCTYYHVLGPVAFRAGQGEAAVKHLNEAVRLHTATGGLPADWLFLALAHQQLGHAEEAQRWLKKATVYLDSVLPDKPAASAAPSTIPWSLRLQWRLLRREAEERIKPPAPPKK